MFKKRENTNIYIAKTQNITCEIIQTGASLYRLFVPDRLGNSENVALTLSNPKDYYSNTNYVGSTLAPCAGRVAKGHLAIDGVDYQLDLNDKDNHLHGGPVNGSNQDWAVTSIFESDEGQGISFQLDLPDGLSGYPGNRCFITTYILSDNCIHIRYEASTDRPTWVSMTNHTYWNLSGDFTQSALNHQLLIHADEVVYNDASHIPDYCSHVADSPFDFRRLTRISSNIASFSKHAQLKNALGYNNAFVLDKSMGKDSEKAILYDENSGRELTIETDSPTIVVYSGGYLDQELVLEKNIKASSSCALAFEAQDFPDSPNFRPDNYWILRPGDSYRRSIKYVFKHL